MDASDENNNQALFSTLPEMVPTPNSQTISQQREALKQYSQGYGIEVFKKENFHKATKPRKQHQVPGPAGNYWIQIALCKRNKKDKKRKKKLERMKKMETISPNKLATNGIDTRVETEGKEGLSDGQTQTMTSSSQAKFSTQTDESRKRNLYEMSNSDHVHGNTFQNEKDNKDQQRAKNAWDSMCYSLDRIVPSYDVLNLTAIGVKSTNRDSEEKVLYELVRRHVSKEYSLLYEITRQYSHRRQSRVNNNKLKVPLLAVSVEAVHCHGHCDWTVDLADETSGFSFSHAVAPKKMMIGWLEEQIVKNNPEWVRPGVVWLLQDSSITAFPQEDDEFDEENNGGSKVSLNNIQHQMEMMILISELNLVYAWTPENSELELSDEMFCELLERRSKKFNEDEEENIDKSALLTTDNFGKPETGRSSSLNTLGAIPDVEHNGMSCNTPTKVQGPSDATFSRTQKSWENHPTNSNFESTIGIGHSLKSNTTHFVSDDSNPTGFQRKTRIVKPTNPIMNQDVECQSNKRISDSQPNPQVRKLVGQDAREKNGRNTTQSALELVLENEDSKKICKQTCSAMRKQSFSKNAGIVEQNVPDGDADVNLALPSNSHSPMTTAECENNALMSRQKKRNVIGKIVNPYIKKVSVVAKPHRRQTKQSSVQNPYKRETPQVQEYSNKKNITPKPQTIEQKKVTEKNAIQHNGMDQVLAKISQPKEFGTQNNPNSASVSNLWNTNTDVIQEFSALDEMLDDDNANDLVDNNLTNQPELDLSKFQDSDQHPDTCSTKHSIWNFSNDELDDCCLDTLLEDTSDNGF